MNKLTPSLLAIAAILSLTGAGCQENKTANQSNPEPISTTSTPQTQESGLVLNAEAVSSGTVKLNWTSSSWTTAEPINPKLKYRMLYSRLDETIYPNRHTFWRETAGTKSEYIWKNVPAGKWNFRACEFINNKCTLYSNTIPLEIK